MKEFKILGITIQYNDENVRIVNSYKIKNTFVIKYILTEFVHQTDYCSRRSIRSWVKEWKAHTRLYRLGLFKTHTQDCDLEEHEKLHRLLIYENIGL